VAYIEGDCGVISSALSTGIQLQSMASLCARSVFLLENSAVKFKWCGETKQIHDIKKKKSKENFITSIMSQDPTQYFEYCNMLPLTFGYIVQAIRQHISHSSTVFQKTIFGRKFVTLRSVRHAFHLIHFISVIEPVWFTGRRQKF
jgi:hypothetical protein